MFIEVQPSANQVTVMEETSKSPGPEEPLPIAEWADRILVAAGPDIERLDWQAIEAALAQRQGLPDPGNTARSHGCRRASAR